MTTDPALLTATELSAAYAAGTLTPSEAVEACLDRIARLDPRLHAFIAIQAEAARRAAEGATLAWRAGHAVGPFQGVPVALKDLIEVEGLPWQGGSAAFAGRIATRTATLARRLIAAGMIVVGKTHTVEFAYGGWGTNARLGTPVNPWDRTTHRVPGGSSSGSGVAVGASLVPWAIGTDTGGSVRMPAGFCGGVGLKVTYGRISCHGVQPLTPSLDTPGPMARSVRDVAALYDVLRGPDPLDPATRGLPADAPLAGLDRGVRGLRLAVMPASERAGCDAAVLDAYDASLEVFARLGADLAPFTPPRPMIGYATDVRIMAGEAYALYADLVDDPATPLDPAVRARILAGRISARDYLAARAELETARAEWNRAFAGYDAFLLPTTPMAAVAVAAVDQSVLPSRFTRLANQMGLCALSLPNGITPEGLPTSLQIVCPALAEADALRIGAAFEAATDWHTRRPPLD